MSSIQMTWCNTIQHIDSTIIFLLMNVITNLYTSQMFACFMIVTDGKYRKGIIFKSCL